MNESKPNWALLAAWRFVLASIVVVFHLQLMWGATFRGSDSIIKLGADNAVLCFLLLSGFSIGHSIKERPQGFVVRRMWRIYPVYLTCLLLSILPFVLWDKMPVTKLNDALVPPTAPQFLAHLFIGQPLLVRSFNIFGPSWTLGVEWGFYMLAPLFLKMSRLSMRWVIALSAVLFTTMVVRVPLPSISGPMPYLCLLWVWLLGFYIVCFDGKYSSFFLMCAPLAIIPRYAHQPLGAFLWTLTVALIYVGHRINLSPAVARFGQKLGDLSYSLYLIHVCASTYCVYYFHTAAPLPLLLAALAMSMAVHYCVELPVNHYRRVVVRNRAMLSQAAP